MRAIGYVKRSDPDEYTTETLDSEAIRKLFMSSRASAGSWGQIEEVERLLKQSSTDPVRQIIEYCLASGHHLISILGTDIKDPLLDAVEAELKDELGSASIPQIPEEFGDSQFTELMEQLEGPQGRPALIVMPDASHLASDLETLVERLLYIRRSGSDAICTDFEMPDPLQNGEELLGLKGEPDWLRKRIREKIREKASRGKVLGRTPYGYRCGADGNLKPVPEEAKVVKQIFNWYVGDAETENPDEGEEPSKNGLGMRLIAQRLTSQNVRTRTGKPWSTATVSIILKNRVYVGTYSRYGFLVSGNHEPIIGRALFRQAQDALMLKQQERNRASSQAPFLLGGLLSCSQCGHGVPGLSRRRSWRRQDDTTASKTYRYYEFYECQHRRNSSSENGNGFQCPKWRADDLDGEVRKTISNWQQDLIRNIRPRQIKLSLDQQLEVAEKTFLSEARIVSTGRGDLETLAPHISEIKRLRQLVEEQAAAEDEKTDIPNKRVYRERLTRDLIADIIGSNDADRAREALHALVERVVVSTDSVKVNPRLDE